MATELDGVALRRGYNGSSSALVRPGPPGSGARGARARIVNLLALYLVLVFGFLGAPGEWVVWAWALAGAFNNHSPEAPEWHDVSAFFCHFLVDD